MNPCPCGYWNSIVKECLCSPLQIQRYISKISGPLLDRIDLHIDVPEVNYKELTGKANGEPSAAVAARVRSARQIQESRFAAASIDSVGGGDGRKSQLPTSNSQEDSNPRESVEAERDSSKADRSSSRAESTARQNGDSELSRPPGRRIYCNAQMSARQIEHYCQLTPACKRILEQAIENFGFSARAYNHILKVSRTIADLEGSQNIRPQHVSEAVQYRSLDRTTWGS